MQLDLILPTACFVEFAAPRAKKAQLVWRNPYGMDGLSIEDHAYCLPLAGDLAESFSTGTKTFLGERYGGGRSIPGRGMSRNGGGVRCGLTGEFQIKGIGQNPLAGVNSDFAHSYGGATLHAAIREAIWGEVCHLALPHGSSRAYGVIATGTHVPRVSSAPSDGKPIPRGLTIRDAALRPAHYMRSLYYEPRPEMARWPTDVQRTKAAIQAIGLGFQSAFGGDASGPLDLNFLNEGLHKMVRRLAAQIAAARAKRIGHGALSASNVGFDGRWLDYGSITAVPDYGRVVIAPNAPDFLSEQAPMLDVLDQLHFYLIKYLPPHLSQRIVPSSQLRVAFSETLDLRLEMEFLKLTGIPEGKLEQIDAAVRSRTYQVIRRIMAPGNNVLFIPEAGEQRTTMKTGRFHLNSILGNAAFHLEREAMCLAIQELVPDDTLRADFVASYWRLRQAYFGLFDPAAQSHAHTFMAANATRLNAPFPELFRTELVPAIESLDTLNDDVETFIDNIVQKARARLVDSCRGKIDLSGLYGREVEVSEAAGMCANGSPISRIDALGSLNKLRLQLAAGVEGRTTT